MESDLPISDSERMELLALREENRLLKLENEKLRQENERLKGSNPEKDDFNGAQIDNSSLIQQTITQILGEDDEETKEAAKKLSVPDRKPERTPEMIQIEKEIIDRKTTINTHRVGKSGKCWMFGIKNLDFDYGEGWDSPDYWWMLINANSVDEGFCLFNMGFISTSRSCGDCKKRVEDLEGLFNRWKSFLR